MYTDNLNKIDKKIEQLIDDKTTYNFDTLRQKVEKILTGIEMFMIEDELDSKAVNLYLKKVITQRNEIAKQKEKSIFQDTKENRYKLIEEICKKCEFNSQEELSKKIEELEKKSVYELKEILNNII
ncbi:hypothetical protein GCM10012288_12400 [Malaciobacter pacificus]|uniref:Uncharacterized protein n=1 Tax=Malaciobacter pacificus TaxID=1080223 RepID=A0A5C2H5I0_9BACT|nr:hypothetical protein [Malaciobacter pacificus]QEP34231.1 hypothetical protein APAC_1106 [Malaciobacter pacificus]GGD39896.1 hypothetical protein GCM10012288_12400 [Malaciobacter pacificus]